MRVRVWISLIAGTSLAAAGAIEGCGSQDTYEFQNPDDGLDASSDDSSNSFADTANGDAGNCTNLQCYQVACPGDAGATAVTGTVYDPAGLNPVYNALVYIPNGTPEPFDDDAGVTCDRCAAFASGSPIAAAITGPDGKFTLTNVPAGIEFPMVIQVGKWRRIVKLPAAPACAATPITDTGLTRLPKNSGEGHIPLMAISTGGADPLECLLRKIGIDDSEFTTPSGSGRIHMYAGHGGVELETNAGSTAVPDASALWGDPDTLRRYDVVLFPCESAVYSDEKTDAGRHNVLDYVNLGGRVFATHYAYTWLELGPQPLPTVANWEHNENDRADQDGAAPVLVGTVNVGTPDASFPKGKAFADWLQNVHATNPYGALPISEWRHDISTVNPATSQMWISSDTTAAWPQGEAPTGAGPIVQHLTFNTPIEAGLDDAGDPLQCGKVVFSDFHVSASERADASPFPIECKAGRMSAQEKALEFMLFDLSACIQVDNMPPPVPVITR